MSIKRLQERKKDGRWQMAEEIQTEWQNQMGKGSAYYKSSKQHGCSSKYK